MLEEELTSAILGAAREVHKHFGPGLLESTYERSLCHELELRGLRVQRQVELPVTYKGMQFDCGYKIDLLVEDRVVVQVLAIEEPDPTEESRLLSYLRFSGTKSGVIINFHVKHLMDGVVRRAA